MSCTITAALKTSCLCCFRTAVVFACIHRLTSSCRGTTLRPIPSGFESISLAISLSLRRDVPRSNSRYRTAICSLCNLKQVLFYGGSIVSLSVVASGRLWSRVTACTDQCCSLPDLFCREFEQLRRSAGRERVCIWIAPQYYIGWIFFALLVPPII